MMGAIRPKVDEVIDVIEYRLRRNTASSSSADQDREDVIRNFREMAKRRGLTKNTVNFRVKE
jgi:hypothetical protein